MSINPADPKWLEILKANSWQTAFLAIAFGVFIILVKFEIVPTTDSPLWIALPIFAMLICLCLFLASVGEELTKIINPIARIGRWLQNRREAQDAYKFIPYMTDVDRNIIGYLLYHNQKMFQTIQDGGHAAPLISKRIIRSSVRVGQTVHFNWVPFEVPDHIWSVLEIHREEFPYEPPPEGEVEEHPWRIHWMAR